MAAGLIHTAMISPNEIPEMLTKTNRYFALGQKSRFFPGFQFEAHWGTPIAQVRKLLEVPESP